MVQRTQGRDRFARQPHLPRMSARIDIVGVTKSYDGNTRAVDAVDMSIREGEFFSLLGPSGCGKTTTLRMIAGFETPTQGVIEVGGVDVTHVPAHKRDMGMVFQNYALFPHRSVGENVAFGLRMRGMERTTIARKVADALAQVELVGYEDRRPGQVEQIGAPSDIYDRPSTRFVADFIGDTNLFRGEVIRNGGGNSVLQVDNGLSIELAAPPEATGAVSIALRPEKISLATPSARAGL